MAKFYGTKIFVFLIEFSLLSFSQWSEAAIPTTEPLCIFHDDELVFGSLHNVLGDDCRDCTIRELANNEVQNLSLIPLSLLNMERSSRKQLDGTTIVLDSCTIVGAYFYAELASAKFIATDEGKLRNSFYLDPESAKSVMENYQLHRETICSCLGGMAPRDVNRQRFTKNKDNAFVVSQRDSKAQTQIFGKNNHVLRIMWGHKTLFEGNTKIFNDGNAKRVCAELLGCRLKPDFVIPYSDLMTERDNHLSLNSADITPPFLVILDDEIAATLNNVELEMRNNYYHILPVHWSEISEKLVQSRDEGYMELRSRYQSERKARLTSNFLLSIVSVCAMIVTFVFFKRFVNNRDRHRTQATSASV